MTGRLTTRVLPEKQRRTLVELTDDLDLTSGDVASKTSAFWTMLTLSAVIATAGVLADSTATVIGAMIIAPLATPIMAMALGVAKRKPGSVSAAGRFVLFGALLVIAIGAFFGWAAPGSLDLLGNTQIVGRTSPDVLDLIAAVATGFAGAVALARRDVAAVLPGVAIAISLVPPLAVVGICLGLGAATLAVGALVLFLSNLVALVLAGTIVFASLGYGAGLTSEDGSPSGSPRRAYLTIALAAFVVSVPLVANTVGTLLLSVLAERVEEVAQDWISAAPGANVVEVEFVGTDLYIRVQTPGDLPDVASLVVDLDGVLPTGIPVVVTTSVGERIEAGTTGSGQ
jgi:uncharacterized hydrophobic protein (TIGR00271 family)